MGLDVFKIHPSSSANFYDWVSFTPTSKISSMGRRMKIGEKRPKGFPFELINEVEKEGWGKIHFTEFLKDK